MFAAEFETVATSGRQRQAAAADASGGDGARDGLARALCRVVEISREGARLQTYIPLVCGSLIRLHLPDTEGVLARVVWASDFSARCQFRKALSAELLESLSSRSWESAKGWLASRREFG